MPSSSEQEVLHWLQPSVDGVVLQLGYARATFLPSVWEQLPDKRSFLQHLKAKAGWPVDFWSPEIQAWRYGTESFEDVHCS
jgi:AMMECR1 domain-containing protein